MIVDIRLLLNLIIFVQCDPMSMLAEAPRKTNSITDVAKESQRDLALRTLMPSSRYCGFQYFDERFTGTITPKYPWLVDVLCDKDNYLRHYTDRCSGVLINNRYVLTSKFCGTFANKVRLAAYNSDWSSEKTHSSDYEYSYQGLGYADTSVFSTVEEFIEPQDKTTEEPSIALLRLSQAVEYSDYVRPICLPLPQLSNPQHQSSLNGIGWNKERTSPDRDSVTLKRKMLTFFIAESDKCCNRTYPDTACGANTSNYLCMTSPLTGNDFLCGDDNGTPLMYQYKYHWVVGGILSSVYTEGSSWCTHNGVVNAIKITADDVNWILENIRA